MIITRNEAKQNDLSTYFTGAPCKRGHVCERRTYNTCCVECGKLSCRRYNKQNTEKIRQIKQTYYQQNQDRYLEYSKEWYQQNRSHKKQYNGQYYQQNKEHLRQYAKEYRHQNPGQYALYNERRTRYLKDCRPKWADQKAINFFYECRPEGSHVDHIIPIIHPLICGLHVETNLQWLPAKVNLSKNNTFE